MIGDRLTRVRRAFGDTQKQMAEKLGVSLPTVRSWEQGKSAPTCEMLANICRLYGVSADELLGLSDVPTLSEAEEREVRAFKEYLLWRREHGAGDC